MRDYSNYKKGDKVVVATKVKELKNKECDYLTPNKNYAGKVLMVGDNCLLVLITNDENLPSAVLVGIDEEHKDAHTFTNWDIVE